MNAGARIDAAMFPKYGMLAPLELTSPRRTNHPDNAQFAAYPARISHRRPQYICVARHPHSFAHRATHSTPQREAIDRHVTAGDRQ
ncbi:hypothetical protein G3O00_04000 [Burkholderia sp. Ac-20384]|uniref:hypothetical protein n=1 Tax=Burkholderia sp. Ac-20384 TaxID=2703902 RepID=UPI00197E39BD|nr:hypothetical protein [Burkholderia sp. Ac-20384]MBN3822780.1 hypothetical protein [Burkholderia sp. Ac-20384]